MKSFTFIKTLLIYSSKVNVQSMKMRMEIFLLIFYM
jgi:hypothetical protein